MATTDTLNEKYKSLVSDNTGTINQMYDANRDSALAGLESAYNQNVSDLTAQKSQIDKQYNTAANDLAVQYERNRQNNNLQAASNGLNVGTGSQMALAQSSAYQRDFGNLRGQQAAAQTEQDRRINDVKMQYQAQVQQAIADNDLARATALTQEANNQIAQLANAYKMQYAEEQDALDRAYQQEQDAWKRQQQEQQLALQRQQDAAALMASGGDFSGYANLYGLNPAQTEALRQQWIQANPEAALNAGMIDTNQYNSLMGSALLAALRNGKISQKEYEALRGMYPVGGTSATASASGGSGGTGGLSSYYTQKVLGQGVLNTAAQGGNVEAAYNDYVQKYGTPTQDTINAWARHGLVINPNG